MIELDDDNGLVVSSEAPSGRDLCGASYSDANPRNALCASQKTRAAKNPANMKARAADRWRTFVEQHASSSASAIRGSGMPRARRMRMNSHTEDHVMSSKRPSHATHLRIGRKSAYPPCRPGQSGSGPPSVLKCIKPAASSSRPRGLPCATYVRGWTNADHNADHNQGIRDTGACAC